MADWHLRELRTSLEKRGWRVAAELPGDDRAISGSWNLKRAGDTRDLMIDFEGWMKSVSYRCPRVTLPCARNVAHIVFFAAR